MQFRIFNIRINDSKKKEQYYDALINDIIKNKCILMVGSGISKKCFGKDRKNLPNWYQFLDSFLNWQYKNKKYSKKEFLEIKKLLKDSSKFQLIAGDLIERTNKEEFKEFLENTFSPKEIYPSYLHKMLCLFPFRAILTTNYDNLIEKAYYEIYKRFPKITSYIDLKKGLEIPENFFIAKIHGDIEDPSSIIISQIDYMNIIHNSPNYIDFLKKIFKNYTVVFAGYSFNDPDIQFIVDKLSFSENYCYIITANTEFTQIECERFFKDQKIIVLGFDNRDKSYNLLDQGFEQILDFLLIKEKALCATVFPIMDKRRFSVLTLYGKNDKEDGLFLRDNFYRNKAIIIFPDRNNFKYSNVINNFDEIAPSIDYVVIFIGRAKIKNTSSNFLKAIKIIEKFKKQFNYRIIIAATPIQKEIIEEEFTDYPTFFMKENFSDIDILPIFNYVSSLIPFIHKCLKISPNCTTCAYFKSKFDSWEEESYELYLKHVKEIEGYEDYLAEKDYNNALKIIDNLILLPDFNIEKQFFRELINDKIICVFKLKEYDKCLELYKIDSLDYKTFYILNCKARSFSNLGNFKEAMKIAQNLENNCRNLREIQKIILLKIKIFENAHKCIDCVEFINQYLDKLPKELEITIYLRETLEKCLSCRHYHEQIERNQ